MKNIVIFSIGIFFLSLLFVACEKSEQTPVYDKTKTVAPEFVAPSNGAQMVWIEADSLEMMTINWTPASYITEEGATLEAEQYVVTVSVDGNINEVIATLDTAFTQSVPAWNDMFIGFGLTAEMETSVVWTVTSDLPSASIVVFSTTINSKVTTYPTEEPPTPTAASLYVPGAYQGWDPATAPQIYDADEDGTFEGYVYFAGDDWNFKFASQPNWDGPNYGTDETEFGLDDDAEAGNLAVPAAGGYWLTCNTVDMVWSYELFNYGVIGSGILAGDWTEDVDMVPAADGPYNVLTVTMDVTESVDGDLRFKIRANDDWAVAYGAEEGSNVLSTDGADVLMPEGPGNYTFVMRWDALVPTYELIKN